MKVAIADGTNDVQWVRSVAERLHNFARDQVAGDGGSADVSTTMSFNIGFARSPVGIATPRTRSDDISLGLVLCTSRRTARIDGTEMQLTRLEYDLLRFLVEHSGRVFTRGQLLNQVWGYPNGCGQRTVDVHVRRLRAKLGGRGPTISTIRGVGYRLDDAHRARITSEM